MPQAEKVEVAGPGFINIYLGRAFVANELLKLRQDESLGIERKLKKTIVIDYSAGTGMATGISTGLACGFVSGKASERCSGLPSQTSICTSALAPASE